jgi:hypothetical protein
MDLYVCRCCGKNDLLTDQMKKEKFLHSNRRGICKKCSSKNESNQEMIRRANKNPENYLSCDKCDGIMKNMTGGRFNIKRTNCRYCKSESVSAY